MMQVVIFPSRASACSCLSSCCPSTTAARAFSSTTACGSSSTSWSTSSRSRWSSNIRLQRQSHLADVRARIFGEREKKVGEHMFRRPLDGPELNRHYFPSKFNFQSFHLDEYMDMQRDRFFNRRPVHPCVGELEMALEQVREGRKRTEIRNWISGYSYIASSSQRTQQEPQPQDTSSTSKHPTSQNQLQIAASHRNRLEQRDPQSLIDLSQLLDLAETVHPETTSCWEVVEGGTSTRTSLEASQQVDGAEGADTVVGVDVDVKGVEDIKDSLSTSTDKSTSTEERAEPLSSDNADSHSSADAGESLSTASVSESTTSSGKADRILGIEKPSSAAESGEEEKPDFLASLFQQDSSTSHDSTSTQDLIQELAAKEKELEKSVQFRFVCPMYRRRRVKWLDRFTKGQHKKKAKQYHSYYLVHPDDKPVFPDNLGSVTVRWPHTKS
ncbi:unnamed protein product [Amoebophrya sp. A25]|nr:unnamed protein product [Amoebophrya sp. A25]|eukprot:GSA25T00010283001.1